MRRRMSCLKATLTLTLVAACLPVATGGAAERARTPADGTVFVRVIGSLHAEIEEAGVTQATDLDRVEIGTGSGFVISSSGYVLTNEHVIGNGVVVITRGTKKAKLTLKVSSIHVCFPPEALAARGLLSPCSEASVAASDPTLDLAVLFISASNLPYVAFGDSDAVSAGQPVDALGYPFGRQLEVGKGATAPDLVPEISTTPGAISALRAGDAGERRFLQISNSVNPGNSGGPVVDRDGFAVGVVAMKLVEGTGIGFAIPINEVKNFLESRGLDQLIPVRRLTLGPFQRVDPKGIGLRIPSGLTDVSPYRSHVETDPQSVGTTLRIDRVFSTWSLKQIEESLVGTQAFERITGGTHQSQVSTNAGPGAPALFGEAKASEVDGDQEIRMLYAITDLGPEKIVARYVGHSEPIKFNESVMRQSLASVEAQRQLTAEPTPAEKLEWSTLPAAGDQVALPIPAGWIVEPSPPSACQGLPQPAMVAAASAPHDFTVVLRGAVFATDDLLPGAAASACSGRSDHLLSEYGSRFQWLGVSYSVQGVFVRTGPRQLVQVEVLSPDQRRAFATDLLVAWLKKVTK
jgi:S1-C subfamily serine protease